MGEAALAREFKKAPPREPLTSITALWRDYMWRYVTGRRGDPAIPFTAASKNVETAIKRACDSKGEDGKTFFHQGRVWPVNRAAYAKALLKRKHEVSAICGFGTFDELYDLCKEIGEATKGIGIVTIYDVTARIAAWQEARAPEFCPEHLYFHAGVTVGLQALGVEIEPGTDRVERDKLPAFFHDKDLDLVESFLCGYRSEIKRVMKDKHKKNRKRGRH
jgi:hypothetical protein